MHCEKRLLNQRKKEKLKTDDQLQKQCHLKLEQKGFYTVSVYGGVHRQHNF